MKGKKKKMLHERQKGSKAKKTSPKEVKYRSDHDCENPETGSHAEKELRTGKTPRKEKKRAMSQRKKFAPRATKECHTRQKVNEEEKKKKEEGNASERRRCSNERQKRGKEGLHGREKRRKKKNGTW
jgi:hypothetical protein